MFTGIVETMGEVVDLERKGTNRDFSIRSTLSHELKIDQSLSHNGVCLTVVKVEEETHWVTAVDETLSKSNLGLLRKGDKLNLERSMLANGRFDGHIVQGHVDQVAVVSAIEDLSGSWLFGFEYDPADGQVTVEKGSVCVNGVSLTCFNARDSGFSVAIIPYTFEHTTFGLMKVGDTVNLEFDIIGKYVQRLLTKQ
jgi:riboflavin synthase